MKSLKKFLSLSLSLHEKCLLFSEDFLLIRKTEEIFFEFSIEKIHNFSQVLPNFDSFTSSFVKFFNF